VLLAVTLLALALPAAVPRPAAADTTSLTGDESLSVPTNWWTFAALTDDEIATQLATNSARLVDIEPYDSTHFTVTMVPDSGSYAATGGWWWDVGLTAGEIYDVLATHNARLIDLQPYTTSSGTRFAVIMVSNAGAAARTWWWYYGRTADGISAKARDKGARVVDIESYVEGGVKKYAAVMVRNTGADAKTWAWRKNVAAADVAAKVKEFGGRIVDLNRQSDGTYNFVMVKNAGSDARSWRFYLGIVNMSSVRQLANQYGMRIFDLNKYVSGGVVRHDLVAIENLSSESRRISNLFTPTYTDSRGFPTGNVGFYLKRVAGTVTVSLNASQRFEPAGAITAVHNLTAMQRVQSGAAHLTDAFSYYNYPNSPINPNSTNACPVDEDEINANKLTTTLNTGQGAMINNGDTRATRGFVKQHGLGAIQTTAANAGMVDTEIDQARIGCWKRGGANSTTLVDLGTLYENVENGSALNDTNNARAEFYQPMSGGAPGGVIRDVVSEEAKKLGKSSSTATAFADAIRLKVKSGSYNIPCGELKSGCAGAFFYFRTVAGKVSIPFKTGSVVTPRVYVWGRFVDSQRIANISPTTTFDGKNAVIDGEILRSTIRSALQTW
jgi:hypothetical protein